VTVRSAFSWSLLQFSSSDEAEAIGEASEHDDEEGTKKNTDKKNFFLVEIAPKIKKFKRTGML
jgi:hypothetical protein